MRTILGLALVTAAACGGEITNDSGGDNDSPGGPDACVGLECEVAKCTGAGQIPTTITGTVFAPNGTLPLYGVDVFVPRDALPPIPDGVTCGACQDLPGSPIVATKTLEDGTFTLENVPAGVDLPIVLSIGKWRREITIPAVTECTSTEAPAAMTRLPKNKGEGNIPKMAITTGDADSLECLFRKIGIEDSEITTNAGNGRVHLYHGDGGSSFASGGTFTEATPFWSSATNLLAYDIVVLSCEGEQGSDTKPQQALEALKEYADAGGRVFASHWHNIWIGGNFDEGGDVGIPSWEAVANWDVQPNPDDPTTATIDQSANPKGQSFAQWLLNVNASTTLGQIPITEGRITAGSLNVSTGAERWVYLEENGQQPVQNFQFTTPIEATPDARCGKVVFSDMHVSGQPNLGGNAQYPNYCINPGMLSPQEKALIFMMFDIASCVSVVGKQ